MKQRVNSKNFFCTFFDSRYLTRGLALYDSLTRQRDEFELWILCMDSATYRFLASVDLANVNLVSLEHIERTYPDLYRIRGERGLFEYYFTCKPTLIDFVLKENPRIDRLTYLDADLYFFADHSLLDNELSGSSIAIVEHRFAPNLVHLEKAGHYNAGWISLKRDATGMACAEWWQQQCVTWCYDRIDRGRYADQGYLDAIKGIFGNVISVAHKGANLAPWNIGNYRIGMVDSNVVVDNEPLIFFHFHGLRRLGRWFFDSGFHGYEVTMEKTTREKIYRPYVRLLCQYEKKVKETQGDEVAASVLAQAPRIQETPPSRTFVDTIKRKIRSLCRGMYRRSYLFCRK